MNILPLEFYQEIKQTNGKLSKQVGCCCPMVSAGKVKMLKVASGAAASGLGGLYRGCKDGKKSWSKDWWNTEQPG